MTSFHELPEVASMRAQLPPMAAQKFDKFIAPLASHETLPVETKIKAAKRILAGLLSEERTREDLRILFRCAPSTT